MARANIKQSTHHPPARNMALADSLKHVTPDEVAGYVESISGELEKMCIHTELGVLAAALKFVRLEARDLIAKYHPTKTE